MLPRIFAVVMVATNEVVYTSESYSRAQAVLKSVDDCLRHAFRLVRYDPCPSYDVE